MARALVNRVFGAGTNKGTTGSTVTLTSNDDSTVRIQPSATITVALPTADIKDQEVWTIYNDASASSGFLLNIQSSAGNAVCTFAQGYVRVIALQDAPTTAAHWRILDLYDYQEKNSVAFVYSNGGGTPPTVNISMARKMNNVVIYIPVVQGTIGGVGGRLTANGAVPTRMRPATSITRAFRTRDNNTPQTSPGATEVGTGGTIDIWKDHANNNFGGTNNAAGNESGGTIDYIISSLSVT